MLPFQSAFRLGLAAATVVAVAACSGGEAAHGEHDGHEHAEGEGHVHSAKFGGTLVELGEHFANIELTHDAEAGTVRLYTYDGHAETSKRSSTEAPVLTIKPHGDEVGFQVTLDPRVNETSGEKVGDSSLFTGQHDSIKGLDHFMVTLAEISIMGETFKDVEFLHPADAHGDGDEHGDHEDGHDDHEGHDHDESDG